ncbi:MAG: hypothetical protein ACYCVD_04190 [Desulfitobacteriaceae bacterium]
MNITHMPQNTGEPFFHPITHAFIPTGAWYDGAAHQEHENQAPEGKPDDSEGKKSDTNNKSGKK